MSRTDKTRPWWVKINEYGICRPRLTEPRPGWDYRLYEHWRGEFRCGCGMCGWPSQSKKLRADDKRAIREGVREWLEDQVL